MQAGNQRESIEARTDLFAKVFLGVIAVTIIALYIKPMGGAMRMPGSQSGFLFNGLLGMCVLELFMARFVAWRGMRMIVTGIADPEWPMTPAGLVVSIAAISMSPFGLAIVNHHLIGDTLKHSIILAGVGGLGYLNYLMLAAKIRESASRE